MGAVRRMASKCRSCPKRESCEHKKMELCAYIEKTPILTQVAMPRVAELMQPMLIPHDYRDIKVAENTTITIDVEELKRQMQKDFYKQMGIGLDYGA